jgi:CBS domain-containing protein
VAFCWLSLGSEGREEQLLRTDQDNALLYADVPEAESANVKQYFLQLAQHVNDTLHACGFVYCPADMMARNPNWCLSLSEWQQQFKRWIQTPDEKAVLYSTIFFDYRPVYGDYSLAEALTTSIYQHLQVEGLFLPILAKNALTNPAPLSFFRSFVVERSGEHKNEFDIKSRAMMPLADAARVLSLHHKLSGLNSTIKRYKKLALLEPNNAALFEEAAMAYEILMRFRATDGFKHQDSGRFIQPEALNKIERLSLKSAFKPIEDLQALLKTRFQLSYLR